jgi:hypothetical protein
MTGESRETIGRQPRWTRRVVGAGLVTAGLCAVAYGAVSRPNSDEPVRPQGPVVEGPDHMTWSVSDDLAAQDVCDRGDTFAGDGASTGELPNDRWTLRMIVETSTGPTDITGIAFTADEGFVGVGRPVAGRGGSSTDRS